MNGIVLQGPSDLRIYMYATLTMVRGLKVFCE